MRREITINPKYQDIEDYIVSIPNILEQEGTIVQNRRNLIKAISYKDIPLNIKRFRKPIFINRIVYSFFRKTKAKRAYDNATEVVKRGFETPYPIAYIIDKSNGLINYSYFISTQICDVSEIRKYYDTKVKGDEDFLKAFAKFTAELHRAGILHEDYSPGNILISQSGGNYKFTLVDINRMKFKKVDIKEGCKNFSRLFGGDEAYEFISKEYAISRGFDIDECRKLLLKYKHKFEKKKLRKKRLKALFK